MSCIEVPMERCKNVRKLKHHQQQRFGRLITSLSVCSVDPEAAAEEKGVPAGAEAEMQDDDAASGQGGVPDGTNEEVPHGSKEKVQRRDAAGPEPDPRAEV